jgi:opacity protein-like surface antigen
LVFGAAPGDCFPWVRRELNGCCRKFDTAKIKAQLPGVSGQGAAAAVVGLFNAYFDPDLGAPVHPHLGVGVGGAYLKLETGDDAPLRVDDEAGASACNLAAGVSSAGTGRFTLSVGYR